MAHKEKRVFLVYGGGSALVLHEIPYEAPKGTLHVRSIRDFTGSVNDHLFAARQHFERKNIYNHQEKKNI